MNCETWETLNDARRVAFEVGIPGNGIRVRRDWLGGKANVLDGTRGKGPKTEVPAAAQKPNVAVAPPAGPKSDIEFEAKMAAYE